MSYNGKDKDAEEEVLIRFLEKTKSGAFAPIKESDLLYVRLKEIDGYNQFYDDDYNYNIC